MNMKTYCITEFELNNMSLYDRNSKAFYSIASILFSIFLSFITEWNQHSPFGRVSLVFMIIISVLLCYLGYCSDKNKQFVIDTIKEESETMVMQLAKFIGDVATGETELPESKPKEDTRNPHAVALSKLGASKGGKARAEKLSSERREEIALKAARKRWWSRKKLKDD
jgi:hypothetical protein